MSRNAFFLAGVASLLMAAGASARAHPHVFAQATLQVTVGPDRTIQSLGNVWRFDDLFSSTVLLEFDANSDLVLDDTELAEVSRVVHESMADYDYFQVVTANGSHIDMKPPEKMIATFENEQLSILFQSKPAEPLKLGGTLTFGIYDPTFYTAIDFYEDTDMMVEGLPDGCARKVVRPDADEALAANQDTLTEAFFNDPMGTDYANIFATRLELTCRGEG